MSNLIIRRTAVILFLVFMNMFTGDIHAQETWKAWKYRMPIKLTHRKTDTADIIPVDVTFSLFADRCAHPEQEIRLILKRGKTEKEVPFQLSRLSRWTKNTDGERSKPTLNGMITFFDEATSDTDAEYVLLYGNSAAKEPIYSSDLNVTGSGPAWTIDNSKMTVSLHTSGQIASVTLKSSPGNPIVYTERGVVHWNPGVYTPTVYWAHAWDWNPPETCEIEQGPIFVEIRRSGVFPKIPDVHLSVTYRIFAERSYVESGTVLRVNEDIGVVALRNDELVFDKGLFDHVAWDKDGTTMIRRLDDYEPVNHHGDILRLSDTAPFVTLFNPAKDIGAATVRDDLTAIGPNGDPPVLFDNATYITNGQLQYWFRGLVYFHVGWTRQQLITVPKGSVYSERNLYLFYRPGSDAPVEEVAGLAKAVGAKPGIQIGEFRLPPEE